MHPNIGRQRVTYAPAPQRPASERERRLRALRQAIRNNSLALGYLDEPRVRMALRHQRRELKRALRVALAWYARHTIT